MGRPVSASITIDLHDMDRTKVKEVYDSIQDFLEDMCDLGIGPEKWTTFLVADTMCGYRPEDVLENGIPDDQD